jgi:hypothetical protein
VESLASNKEDALIELLGKLAVWEK